MKLNKQNKILLILFSLALLYRVIYVIYGGLDPVRFDASSYDSLAKSILFRGDYHLDGEPAAFYTPGYPIFLAIIYKIFGVSNFLAVRLVQSILSIFSLFLAYRLAKHWFSKKVALIFLLISTIYSPYIYANQSILTEVLYSTVLLILISYLHELYKKKNNHWTRWMFFGYLWGVLLMIRPITALLLPTMLLLTFLKKLKFIGFKNALVVTTSTLVILSPWTVRNWVQFHKFVPLSAESGNVFLLGTYVDYIWEYDYKNWPVGKNRVETDSLKIRYGLQRISQNLSTNPYIYTKWYLTKFHYFWYRVYSGNYFLIPDFNIQVLGHIGLVDLSIVGMLIVIYRRSFFPLLIIGLLTYLTIMHMAFMTLDRLAFPTTYFVLMFSAVSINKVHEIFKAK